MLDDPTYYKAKLTNLGLKSGWQIAIVSMVVAPVTCLLTAGLLKLLGSNVLVIAGVTIAVFFLVPLPLIIYLGVRSYYLTFDGSEIKGQRIFYTVHKQVRASGHQLGKWKGISQDENRNSITIVAGPVVNVACQDGELAIGCFDPISKWLKEVPENSTPISPAFTIEPRDFRRLVIALGVTERQ